MSDKECIVRVENVSKVFGKDVVLENINTEICKGDIIAIIGPSGCGKSTFIRMLNMLEKPSKGDIYIDGIDLCDPKVDINKMRERIGMVFQQFNLFPHMTVLKNLTIAPMKLLKMPKEEAEKKYNLSKGCIKCAIKKNWKSAGYHWEYI